MRVKKLGILLCAALFNATVAGAQTWNDAHAIGTVTGETHFSYNQTPAQLVEIRPAAFPNTGLTYQWESGITPLNLSPISGANGSSYAFSSPLSQTTYFRRITSANGSSITSNTIKIQVVSASWEDRNYIRQHSVRITGQTTWQAVDALAIGDKLQTTSYMDGLGRSVQQISKGTATPAQPNGQWGDMVQFSVYDGMGKEPIRYLPYTTTTEGGKFKTSPGTEQPQYYTSAYGETSAFGQITFDNSPLNRVKNIKAPGSVWAASAGNSADYEVNATTDGVQFFSVSYTLNSQPVYRGPYAPGTLYKSVSTDENGKKVLEFTDKEGKLILRKVQLDDNPSSPYTGWICTYNVYDEFGQLRFQLQPEAVNYLSQNGWSFGVTNGQKVLDELCFQYFYDDKGRNIWKKSPGAEPLFMVYDNRDRLVFTQDGNQRTWPQSEWTATLYDALDRPLLTALYKTPKNLGQMQQTATAGYDMPVSIGSPGNPVVYLVVNSRDPSVARYAAQSSIEFAPGFETAAGDEFVAEIDPTATDGQMVTITPYQNPISSVDLNDANVCTILKYQFYDDYSFTKVKPFRTGFTNTTAYSTGDPNVQPIAKSKRTLSFPTGNLVRVLGTATFLASTSYYDERSSLIQTLSDNIKSGSDATTLQYHFDGRVLSSCSSHTTAGTGYSAFQTLTKYLFDKIGRVTSIEKSFGSNAPKAVVAYGYDDMGRLKTKRLAPGYTATGKDELESLTYSYNLHNLLTGINKDYALKTPGLYQKWDHFFGLYLGYDNKDGTFGAARLNGQVTGALWNTQGDDAQRKYDYGYDNAGRLVTAQFNEKKTATDAWSHAAMDFSITGAGGKIGYDLNGNLTSMIQKGVTAGSAAPVVIDDLQYSYATLSNKLMRVADASPLGANNGKAGDFKDGANAGDDYVYDANGNLVVDLNKSVKDLPGQGSNGIRYNFLDKPEEIRLAGKGTIKLVYDADGNKLQRTFTPEGGGGTVTTSYASNFVYQETVTNSQSSGLKLQYFSFEEGRVRPMQYVNQNNGYDLLSMDGNLDLPGGSRGAVDYYLRDYQQNVRMLLTEETHLGSNQCTMETARASGEEALFGQPGGGNEVALTRYAVSDIPGQSNGDGWNHPYIQDKVSRLGALAASKAGPNALLKVMAGDEVSSMADYYYQNGVSNGTGNNLLQPVLTSLISAITGGAVASPDVKGGTTGIYNNLNDPASPFAGAVAPDANNPSGNVPKAYLNILFFNERMEYVAANSTAVRVQGSGNGQSPLQLLNIKAPKNGYCYVYLSNESNEHVYFDNFKVTHNRGRIIEENHYYAYGLRIQAISSKKVGETSEGHLDNQNLYNDKELIEDGDLGWYDYGFRNYDPQIGRFPQLDPLTFDYPFYTPYQYAGGDPIANVDMDGLEPAGSVIGTLSNPVRLQEVVVSTSRAAVAARALGSATSLLGTGLTLGGTVTSTASRQFAEKAIEKALERSWWQKGLEFLGRNAAFLGRFGGTAVGVLIPLDAGPRIPEHIPAGYHVYGDLLVKDPPPTPSPTQEPKPKLAPDPPNNPSKPAPPDDDDKYLVRFGSAPESAEKLAADAAKAEQNPYFGHGVSTTVKKRISGSDKANRSAAYSEVIKVFPVKVTPTKNNPNHRTVTLPKPVTKEVADKFNALFKTAN